MRKEKILVILAASALTVFLFYLPKAAVRKNASIGERGAQASEKAEVGRPLGKPLTPEAEKTAFELRQAFFSENNKEERAEIADRLVKLFEPFGTPDSIAVWSEKAAEEFGSAERWIAAGDAYYSLLLSRSNIQERRKAVEKARTWYEKVGENDPHFADAKAKAAMTYAPSDNSMPTETVAMLREVLAKYPNNETALFNLGLLSMQSGQLEKAEERFKKIVDINPENTKAVLHLAMVYRELGNGKKAAEYLEKVKNQEKDTVSRAAAEAFLKELKK